MILFLILILLIWLISKKSENVRFWKEKIIQQPLNYYLLLGLLVVGFLFRLDYTANSFGCFVFAEPVFEFRNILFSAISITLVLLSFFSKKRTIKLAFISLELLFWVSKLFLFKGGYLVGIVNAADPMVSLYDATVLTLRLFIINSLLKTNIKQVYILICAIVVMSLKIYAFPMPYNLHLRQKRALIEAENTKNFLMGKWIENRDTTDKIRIVFYPESAILYNVQNNDSLFLDDIIWGGRTIWLMSFGSFEFEKKGNDTINVQLNIGGEIFYSTQMIREVDFVMQYGAQIVPIEVKSGTNVNAKSLKVFREKYSPKISVRFSMKGTRLDDDLQNISLRNIFLFEHLLNGSPEKCVK